MCHSLLHHHIQKEILFKRNMCREDIEQTCLNKQASRDLISPLAAQAVILKKSSSKSFSDASNSSDINKDIIKQINRLKPFNMEPCKAIPMKCFVSEEENTCEEEINLTPQERIGNADWYKCGCECKLMATFAESFCLFLWLKSWSVRGASRYSAFMCNSPTINYTS